MPRDVKRGGRQPRGSNKRRKIDNTSTDGREEVGSSTQGLTDTAGPSIRIVAQPNGFRVVSLNSNSNVTLVTTPGSVTNLQTVSSSSVSSSSFVAPSSSSGETQNVQPPVTSITLPSPISSNSVDEVASSSTLTSESMVSSSTSPHPHVTSSSDFLRSGRSSHSTVLVRIGSSYICLPVRTFNKRLANASPSYSDNALASSGRSSQNVLQTRESQSSSPNDSSVPKVSSQSSSSTPAENTSSIPSSSTSSVNPDVSGTLSLPSCSSHQPSTEKLSVNNTDLLQKGEVGKEKADADSDECPVCLSPCVHPARLPCSHVFCYLCLKGIARSGQPCPMCRAPIPYHYADHPQLIPSDNAPSTPQTLPLEKPLWFYQGRNGGWWQFEERMSDEIEANAESGNTRFEMMICGSLYVIDTVSCVQYPKHCPIKTRRILRDLPSRVNGKGVAGIHGMPLGKSMFRKP